MTTFADLKWEETGPDDKPWARLTACARSTSFGVSLAVCGIPMHVEAYAVEEREGIQVGSHEWADEMIDAVHQIDEGLGPMHTFDWQGRSYVIVAYPYGD